MADVKFGALEIDGVDLDFIEERLLVASDLKVDTTTNTLVGNYLQSLLDYYCAPAASQLPTYLGNGEVDTVTFYSSATQITANRIAKVQVNYTSTDPTSEVWSFYDSADGTTVLKTVTLTHTWVNHELTKTETVTV